MLRFYASLEFAEVSFLCQAMFPVRGVNSADQTVASSGLGLEAADLVADCRLTKQHRLSRIANVFTRPDGIGSIRSPRWR